jgi:uncharacterized membrane protein (UPF0127 family)
VAVIVLALGVFLVQGANRPRRPELLPAGAAIPARGVAGFGEVGFRVENPFIPAALAGRTRCALLAATTSQRSEGLMHRRDLAGYDGMVFEFDGPTTDGFYMKDTVIPLSIAWFSQGGRFVSSTTMPPCPKSTASCPVYSAAAPYSVAIEVAAGRLPGLGIGPGSAITVGGPC